MSPSESRLTSQSMELNPKTILEIRYRYLYSFIVSLGVNEEETKSFIKKLFIRSSEFMRTNIELSRFENRSKSIDKIEGLSKEIFTGKVEENLHYQLGCTLIALITQDINTNHFKQLSEKIGYRTDGAATHIFNKLLKRNIFLDGEIGTKGDLINTLS